MNRKNVLCFDIIYVCIIIRGTIKKIKIEFIKRVGPSHRAKTVRDLMKIDLDS